MAKPNVSVVTSGIEDIVGRTLYTKDGQSYELDILVLATGFDVEGFAGNIQSIIIHKYTIIFNLKYIYIYIHDHDHH